MKTQKLQSQRMPLFFHDKPLFGMDIGHGSLKVMQLAEPRTESTIPKVIGYGFAAFDREAQADGAVTKPEVIAKAALRLFKDDLVGDITTRRVALAIPAYRTFTRSLHIPNLRRSEVAQAIELEAEQYITVPLEQLYLDYEVVGEDADSLDILLVAVPRTIVDSYLQLASIMGLETVLVEPTLSSSSRLLSYDRFNDVTTLIADFGTASTDISILNRKVLATGTVEGGGQNFTATIKKALGVSDSEAGLIKTRYGLGPSRKQAEIHQAIDPTLQKIVKEIRRITRYYEERYGNDRPIGQVVTLGGGANMPGLSDYLTAALRLPVRHSDPWQSVDYKGLQPPSSADRAMYATVTGLALAKPSEVLA